MPRNLTTYIKCTNSLKSIVIRSFQEEIKNVNSSSSGTLTVCSLEHKIEQIGVSQFSLNVNIYLPYNLSILLLGIYSRQMKIYAHKTCLRMFLVV